MAVIKYLEELSVEQLINKYNFIIPEIQREYVWGNNEHKILDKFFADIAEGISETSLSEEDQIQVELFEKMLLKADNKDKQSILKLMDTYLAKKDMNIGFLYSYKPGYYIYNDLNEDVYLIDGQQRFTTLFLSLFYFALKEKENYDDFFQLFKFDSKIEKIGFDYRVRTLTHNFLIELLARCTSVDDLLKINEKTWFLTDFDYDVTVRSMIQTLKKLHDYFKKDDKKYYQFIKKQIKFWHFKTEETSQGEELYITMNSRGQQLADNETLRASLFENEKVKKQQIEWGAKWEVWQDFFWQHKVRDGNADFGLNQFLKWANIIECFTTQTFNTKEDAEKKYKSLVTENQLLEYVSMFEIEHYFKPIYVLATKHKERFFDNNYFRSNFSIDWLKSETSQLNLMKLLPALMYLKADAEIDNLNRFVRFFCNLTYDIDVSKNPDTYIIDAIQLTSQFLKKGYSDISNIVEFKKDYPKFLNSEEIFKLSFYKIQDELRPDIEELFWTAEDFQTPKGKVGHLIQMTIFEGLYSQFSFNRSFNYQVITSFNYDNFKKISSLYTEAIKKEYEIWGDLINTEMYVKYGDRLSVAANWKLNNSLLKFVLERYSRSGETLEGYLIAKEKDFVNSYNEYELVNEIDPKKQIFIYYIIHKRILNNWVWENWNFGIYDGNDYPEQSSIFNRNYIYQFYNSQWRYNVGYQRGSGIWLQDHYDSNRNYLLELVEWAKLA